MTKQLGIGLAAISVIAVIVVGYFFAFANKTPSEDEVRRAVAAALPTGARIDRITFAAFPSDRSTGRVSVNGTFSFENDIYSLPTRPQMLLNALASDRIFDSEVSQWWAENSSIYPQFKGRLGEYRRVYSTGESQPFRGELPYIAVVDGVNIANAGLEFERIEGVAQPSFGYLAEAETVRGLRAAIVTWHDRRQAEEQARRKAEQAERLAREHEAAEIARVRAAAEAVAREEARIAAERALEESRRPAQAGPCLKRYTDQLNCNTVRFGVNEYYDRTALAKHCIISDPSSAVQREHLGGDQYRYTGRSGLVVQFFDAPVGAFKCGM